jgi:peptidoglycan DL-endopeptidase CwlO
VKPAEQAGRDRARTRQLTSQACGEKTPTLPSLVPARSTVPNPTTPAAPHQALARPRRAVVAVLTVGLLAGLVGAAAPAQASTFGQRVVAEAQKHQGKPYVYGATGPDRFDCSGFTLYVFSRFGKKLPHNSAQQYSAPGVKKVANSSKQLGDLIFMRSSSGRITHVGIYAGSGKWWVAPKSGDRVKLQALYSSNYVTGRVT